MKINYNNWWILIVAGSMCFIGTNGLHAEEQRSLPKGMTPEKLEKSVTKTISYVDKRLLSGKNAEKIERSGNDKAVALLQSGREEMANIGEQVKQGQYEAAYWALKELNKSLKEAMKLARAKERAAKEAKDVLESVRTISDAYHERAVQRGLGADKSGKEAHALFKQAEEARAKAQSAEVAKDAGSAIKAYERSTEQLKKAIAIAKKRTDRKPTSEVPQEAVAQEQPAEKRGLPKGMTPEKLEKSVTKTLSYVDKRLLSGKNAEKIERSGNDKAVALLQSGREEMAEIGKQVKQGQYAAAYWALKELNKSLKEAMKLARAKERAAKEAKDVLESARTISDAYHERAIQRGLGTDKSGKEANALFKQAEGARAKAAKDVGSAINAYERSTEQLKKAIAMSKKR